MLTNCLLDRIKFFVLQRISVIVRHIVDILIILPISKSVNINSRTHCKRNIRILNFAIRTSFEKVSKINNNVAKKKTWYNIQYFNISCEIIPMRFFEMYFFEAFGHDLYLNYIV